MGAWNYQTRGSSCTDTYRIHTLEERACNSKSQPFPHGVPWDVVLIRHYSSLQNSYLHLQKRSENTTSLTDCPLHHTQRPSPWSFSLSFHFSTNKWLTHSSSCLTLSSIHPPLHLFFILSIDNSLKKICRRLVSGGVSEGGIMPH